MKVTKGYANEVQNRSDDLGDTIDFDDGKAGGDENTEVRHVYNVELLSIPCQ